ncbi:CDP-diacylglycerol--serine O-phosphatidyltransferase [Paenibacillus filicis]|uniref:CDP-diacylglycerol--serine O-phosphatidyltransferase n=1 Tax=Paenibacillus gyeongsangnamensis TaxID=3388067 RepID=A0ABT4Q9Q5_9BACL|nr:CDP-diacylglycerol--serine O-phosphatidyltransferase [Paenibacillus filicis]MCZ8513568.1 CDP-diacylglycerol--serine O-phosphatidyltransferase [Paenibacillus filicis]
MQKIVQFFPNIFTLANLSSGIVALVLIVNHLSRYATILVLFSALFDLFDGKIARSLKVTNGFGVELDSLADIVSFGVVPALAFYETSTEHFISALVLIIFPISGALRLARFMTHPTQGYFEGLPITAAGLTLCLLLWLPNYVNAKACIALLLAFLMISKMRIRKL